MKIYSKQTSFFSLKWCHTSLFFDFAWILIRTSQALVVWLLRLWLTAKKRFPWPKFFLLIWMIYYVFYTRNHLLTTHKFSYTYYNILNTYPHTHANRDQTRSQIDSCSDGHPACSHTRSEDRRNWAPQRTRLHLDHRFKSQETHSEI